MKKWKQTEAFKKGMKHLKTINGETSKTIVDFMEDLAPDLSRYVVEFAYGEVYASKILDNQQKQLITLTVLATQNSKLLPVHIRAALNVGLSEAQIIGCFTHLCAFAGFPTAIQSILTAKKVFQEKKS